MPNRSALIRRLAYLLNISYPKAHLCGVMLSEAGQVKSGGRGRSAPNMTARDAFAILIAVTAAEKNSEAIQAVSTYSNILNEDGEKFRDILTLILNQPEAAEHINNLKICRTFPYATIAWKNDQTDVFLSAEGLDNPELDPIKRNRVMHIIPGFIVCEIARFLKSEGPRPLSPEEIEEILRLIEAEK